MSNPKTLYTYRCGEKLALEKDMHQFVVRTLPENLKDMDWGNIEQVSSASSRVFTNPAELEYQMNISRGMAATHHAYRHAETQEEFLITDRIFVRFKEEEPSEETLNDFLTKYSLIYLDRYGPKEYLFQLTDYTGMNPVKLVVLLTEKEDLIESAGHDLNRRMEKYQTLIPDDRNYLRQWHLHERSRDREFDARSSSRCEVAWELLESYGSMDVVVGVTDDGCRLDHQDFNSNGKFAAWGYFRNSSLLTDSDFQAEASKMYQSGANHGTSCAGVIAGEVDGVKTVGAAPGCRLLPIKWESDGPSLFISDSKLLTALRFVEDKVDILSNSWGVSPRMVWENEVINKIRQLSQNGGRRGKGIVFLWAAGNENCPIEHRSNQNVPYTSGFSGGTWVGVRTARVFRHNLADLSGVMHIAALASTAKRSHYSNYGTAISLCAPSSNGHKYGRLELDGLGITTTVGFGSGVTNSFGGTSSATPLVAGVAALVISANPSLSAKDVISILKRSASKDLNFEGYRRTPPAPYNRDTSWDVSPIEPFEDGSFKNINSEDGTWSPWFGYGKLDAANAVSAALASIPDSGAISFQKTGTPNLSIPDNTPEGVSHSLDCTAQGKLESISVDVDIIHTYRGDLVVTLSAPSGKTVTLHNRSGGSANNIQTNFNLSDHPVLRVLVGESITGKWVLSIQDLAPADQGTLREWTLTLNTASESIIELEALPGLRIPDNAQAGIKDILNVNQEGIIKDIRVEVDISHTYISDLLLSLRAPSGNNIILHNRTGGSRDNLIRSYDTSDTSRLEALIGSPSDGVWELSVADRARRDIGKLNRWKLIIVLET